MNFVELHIQTSTDLVEILIAELGNLAFDTFEETDDGLNAYAEEVNFDLEAVNEIIGRYNELGAMTITTKLIPKENWNEEWEKNFHPITVKDQILVRADFHEPQKGFPYEIIIVPKMSFGTGHHDTTSQMLQWQLQTDQKDKTVLDAGTGTGILSIMAGKCGASKILANDIDEWCIDNSQENFSLNECQEVDLRLGDIQVFEGEQVDIILANINKNVLLKEIPFYAKLLKTKGSLILSGFYEHDIPDLEQCLTSAGLKKEAHTVQNNWAAIRCMKAS